MAAARRPGLHGLTPAVAEARAGGTDGVPGEHRDERLTADDVAAEDEETELEASAQLNLTEGGDTLA